ncbi:MAG TPA: DMT family transporter [Dongiaceae bacterium]|jgi:drug/metabolite transporter (DMT)-like permease|nr:DMT family transporter [Dongiaceae bacterium]
MDQPVPRDLRGSALAAGARGDALMRPQQRLKGALILSAAVFVTGLQDAFIKDISAAYPVWEMQIFRGGMALLLIFGWIVAGGGLRQLLTTRPSGLLLARSLVLSVASLSFYVSLAGMQFADAVAIYFSLPLMIAALSGALIGEHVPPRRWVAIAVAFVGVAIIAQPTSDVFNPASLIALFSTLCYAIGLMLTRPVGMRVPSAVMGLWQLMGFVTTGIILGLVFGGGAFHDPAHPSFSYLTQGWIAPAPRDLLEMLAFGVAAALATILYTAGYKVVAPSFVAPFEYQSLFWASIWGFAMWGDVPAATTFYGAALIVAAGLWMIWREARHQGSGISNQK